MTITNPATPKFQLVSWGLVSPPYWGATLRAALMSMIEIPIEWVFPRGE
jgi:hypothetical protein